MVDLECVDVSDRWVAVGGGVQVPRSWTVVLRGEPDVPGEIRVHAVYAPRLRRVVASQVTVTRGDETDEVTSLTLREVRVQYALQTSGMRVAAVSEPGERVVNGAGYMLRVRERGDRSPIQTHADAARLYQLATAINLPPLKTVADNLGVSQSTATRIMGRVRRDGIGSGSRPWDPSATGPVIGPPSPSGGPSLG